MVLKQIIPVRGDHVRTSRKSREFGHIVTILKNNGIQRDSDKVAFSAICAASGRFETIGEDEIVAIIPAEMMPKGAKIPCKELLRSYDPNAKPVKFSRAPKNSKTEKRVSKR